MDTQWNHVDTQWKGSGTDRLGSNWWLQGLVINLQLKI
jgi:hypothetical protein